MKKTIVLSVCLLLLMLVPASAKKKEVSDRAYWSALTWKMSQPVLENMAKGELQAKMQTEFSPSFDNCNKKVLYMECFGRLMAGIAPWLSLPNDGRSIPYRMAAMQPLALIAWYKTLPKELSNGQVRAALTKSLHRMFDDKNNFNKGGYLTIGFCGHQPNVADWYTNNGSLYMTSLVFMPLGLPATDPFWTDAAQPWTQVKAWGGKPFPKDHRWADTIKTADKW